MVKRFIVAVLLAMLVMSFTPAVANASETPSTSDLLEYPTDGMLAWFSDYVENADETCEALPAHYLTDEGLDYFKTLGWQGIAGDKEEALYHPECL